MAVRRSRLVVTTVSGSHDVVQIGLDVLHLPRLADELDWLVQLLAVPACLSAYPMPTPYLLELCVELLLEYV